MSFLVRHFILISLFCSTHALSQRHLDYCKVLSDKNFSCNTDQIRLEGKTNTSPVYSTELKTICDSKNELEIRFYNATTVTYSWRLYVITYDNGQWNATEYWNNFGRKSYDSSHPIIVFSLRLILGFDSLFKALKKNKIFTLPDEGTIKYELDYTDPVYNVITYKVQNKFRRYRILYPSNYRAKYPKIKAFEYYEKLLDIFFHSLQRQ